MTWARSRRSLWIAVLLVACAIALLTALLIAYGLPAHRCGPTETNVKGVCVDKRIARAGHGPEAELYSRAEGSLPQASSHD